MLLKESHLGLVIITLAVCGLIPSSEANNNVHVSRFWHNHQPLYWPEWNTNGGQTNRGEYAWDSIVLKENRSYGGSGSRHPENNLSDIFGKDDRRNAYQSGPRNALTNFDNRGGFALSYSGSLIDNIRQLGGGGHLGYGGGWNGGNSEARNWTTPSGGPRLDLVGFTYHHSLAPLLPKEVLRKEIQIFKQAWWKAWGGNPDLSDHSKGFFPTEMGYSRHIVDVLVDEGYQWVIVPSHHISRTCPTYFDQFNLEAGNYNIFSSPPNKADLLGPSPTNGWWYSQPNPGNAAWNVAPYAYQLHKVKYVNPETGAEKTMIAVPSDDVLSYRYGYANEGISKIGQYISPHANDPSRPVLVMPSTDGDNAWGGGSSSWYEATPQFFNGSAGAGYVPTTPQDFVNAYGGNAPVAHIEDGAWIFPESDYGSPYFLKWIEPPVAASGSSTVVPGTVIDMETPGFALKFWSWAPVITGANWVETAEQIARDEDWVVRPWVIQAPYDWGDGDISSWNPGPNDVELAWHIYLKGLDSGFNYYGGLGNDDEVKPALAATRAIQKLQPWMTQTRRDNDRTPPSVLKPQRFPYNPGAYTFGWFNSIPGGNTSYLKKMPSEFYIWTHAYDLNGITSVNLKVRVDNDGFNPLHDNQNETYTGGNDVGDWVTIAMTKRTLPNDQTSLNAAANNGQINYFITPPELADYYFVKITNANLNGFRGKLLDYYIEATDSKGNVHKSEIQHVWVEDDGAVTDPPVTPDAPEATAVNSGQVDLSWDAVPDANGYRLYRDGNQIVEQTGTTYSDTGLTGDTTYTYTLRAFNNAGESDASTATLVTTPEPPLPPATPAGLQAQALSPTTVELSWQAVENATQYRVFRNGSEWVTVSGLSHTDATATASTTYAYTLAAGNSGGWSSPTAPASVTTPATPPSFHLGQDDHSGYLLDNPGMRIFAAIRGTLLYVGTWTTSGGVNDHFILVTDHLEPSATVPAPWGKAGSTAHPEGMPYLASESVNDYIGWFNAPGGQSWKDSQNGGRMEGVIDLVEVFGTMPDSVYIAAVAYQTGDAGLLGAQSPEGNADGNLDTNEFIEFPVNSIRDTAGSGVFDRLDPLRGLKVRSLTFNQSIANLSIPVIPGKSYRLLASEDLGSDPFSELTTFDAHSGDDELIIEDGDSVNHSKRFYQLETVD
jgi:fibronectin type 3 domain-containing protein